MSTCFNSITIDVDLYARGTTLWLHVVIVNLWSSPWANGELLNICFFDYQFTWKLRACQDTLGLKDLTPIIESRFVILRNIYCKSFNYFMRIIYLLCIWFILAAFLKAIKTIFRQHCRRGLISHKCQSAINPAILLFFC